MIELKIPGPPMGKQEIWKEIPGFSNYLASNKGRIYSKFYNKTLKQCGTKDGYLKVTLYKNHKGTTKKSHRFIALTFIPNKLDKPQINHKDGNKKNNNIENLEWCTLKENINHAKKTGLINSEKAKAAYKTRLRIYGKEYLSKKASEGAKKCNAKQSVKTKEKIYGKGYMKKLALIASKKAREKNIKKTKIIDTYKNNKIIIFNSRVEAAKYIGTKPKRVVSAMKEKYKLKKRYICEEG